jgi:hypothetical protein
MTVSSPSCRFEDAFGRYLPPSTSVTSVTNEAQSQANVTDVTDVTDTERPGTTA